MLTSISPIDGRYENLSQPLSPYFSEMALMRYRIIVEGEYLIALLAQTEKHRKNANGLTRKLSKKEIEIVRSLYDLSPSDVQIISDIEKKGYKGIKATDHDVKAIEYYIKDKLQDTSLANILEWVHFALTSEDTNNLSYGLMLREGLNKIILPKIEEIINHLEKLAKQHSKLPMLARTHGQSASPTTFGKEFKVFSERIKKQLNNLKNIKISCKLNGATGNYNAHQAAIPKVNWLKFSQNFISGLSSFKISGAAQSAEALKGRRWMSLVTNLHTTQIEPHDSYIEIFDCLKHINTILIGLNQDIWRYVSDDWIVQKPQEGAVGSSTMPHKVNPIKFENSEGNLGLANALFNHFAVKLPISRLQRDLSDSTVQRNFGSAFGYSLIAYEYLLKGLSSISINEHKVTEVLNNHPEVIAEAIQTILRREGIKMPYEKLRELTRGKKITLADIYNFVDDLDVTDNVKKELKAFTPQNYTGLASKLANL